MNSTQQGNGSSSWTVRGKRDGPGITVKRKKKKRKSVSTIIDLIRVVIHGPYEALRGGLNGPRHVSLLEQGMTLLLLRNKASVSMTIHLI